MNSVILQTAVRYMLPLILLFSIVMLLQGHHRPGGGFIGGLIAAAALALHAIAFGPEQTRATLRIDLSIVIGAGLLISLASGLVGLFDGEPLLTGVWAEVPVPGFGEVKIGTPLLFDLGVYFVVIGVTVLMALLLLED
jgi:multicomponent Na+:H+ antiporter subunit B